LPFDIKSADFLPSVCFGLSRPERALEEGIDALNSYRQTLEELGRPVPAGG
jgi:hypothetical protein